MAALTRTQPPALGGAIPLTIFQGTLAAAADGIAVSGLLKWVGEVVAWEVVDSLAVAASNTDYNTYTMTIENGTTTVTAKAIDTRAANLGALVASVPKAVDMSTVRNTLRRFNPGSWIKIAKTDTGLGQAHTALTYIVWVKPGIGREYET